MCSSAAPLCYLVYSFWVLVLTNQVNKLITLTSKLSCFVSLAHSPVESRASKEVFGSLSSYYKELKLTTKLFAGRTVCGLLIQMQNIHLWSSGMHRKQNFEFLGLKVTQQSWLLLFASYLLPSFFAFLASFFFLLLGIILIGFILVRRVFRKAFRILGLGERKGRWVVERDFRGNFRVNVTWFFAFYSGVLDWIVLILVWFERSLHSAHISRQSCLWTLKLMTSQAVAGTWICTGGYGRLRGEWVTKVVRCCQNYVGVQV